MHMRAFGDPETRAGCAEHRRLLLPHVPPGVWVIGGDDGSINTQHTHTPHTQTHTHREREGEQDRARSCVCDRQLMVLLL